MVSVFSPTCLVPVRPVLGFVLALLALSGSAFGAAQTSVAMQRSEPLSEAVDVGIRVFPAQGRYVALWIAPGFGFREGQRTMARLLAEQGIEVWQADIADSLFLARGSPAMRSLDGRYVADLIQRTHEVTGKSVVLIGSSYGAIPVLRGARQWQARRPSQRDLVGAVLFSPNVYATIPPLGVEPEYLPISTATSIPIAIFQGQRTGNRWQLDTLLERLRRGGSQVYVQIMPDVVGLFYEPDRPPPVQTYFETLPGRIAAVLPLLELAPLPLQAKELASADEPRDIGLNAELRPFQGNPVPEPIRLPDARGRMHRIDDFRGKVTLVNFWATWCPPCVEEIPSLNRLRKQMQGKAFSLVSVDYAEEPDTILEFMEQVQVDFPVLLDHQGRVAARWGVVVFPSTFVIGPNGRIRYGVNAAIEWDTPEVVRTLEQLMPSATP